jgi:hypothetical protein
MSFPLTFSTSGSSGSTSTSGLHAKRLRGFSDEHEFDASTQGRRKQLKIDIPPPPLYLHSPRSSCSALPSVKESPSSLFSAASEVEQISNEDATLPISQSQLVPDASLSATSSTIDPDQLVGDLTGVEDIPLALLTAPPIHGLYFNPTLSLPHEIASSVMNFCLKTYFRNPNVNQVMLFGRAPDPEVSNLSSSTNYSRILNNNASSDSANLYSTSMLKTSDCTRIHNSNDNTNITGLPTVFINLLSTLSTLLKPFLPEKAYTLLFPSCPTQARQAIINLYNPGEGISPHVDLLGRYGDGIIGVSFGSGCVMKFDRVAQTSQTANGNNHVSNRPTPNDDDDSGGVDPGQQRDRWDLYLPERSVLVLSEDARYGWTHGIDKITRDYVSASEADAGLNLDGDGASEMLVGNEHAGGRWIERGVRLSVTFRWLLPGADVVGPETS